MTLPGIPCPPGLVGVTLIYWGWHLDLWYIGFAAALILETANRVPWRFDIDEKQFFRLLKLTTIGVVLTGIVFILQYTSDAILHLVKWLPAVLFVLIAAQCYSDKQGIPVTAIVARIRTRSRLESAAEQTFIDLRLPFFFLTLIAVSVVTPKTHTFYLVSSTLVLWCLWSSKPRHYHRILWLSFSGLAVLLGFIAHIGLSQLQGTIQELTTSWLQADWSQRNISRNSTAIGQIGRLKMSEEIIMRIRNSNNTGLPSSILLQQAEYDRYSGTSWHVDDRMSKSLPAQPEMDTWYLSANHPATSARLNISTYLKRGEGVLALPRESYTISYDKSADFSTNKYGSIRIENAQKLMDFSVDYGVNDQKVEETSDKDLEIPVAYKKLMAEVVDELGLARLTPIEATRRLAEYFARNYRYSLIQDELASVYNPMRHFLRQSRKGHCEYFATAGALILRAAGIPTRYASGFLMSEYDSRRGLFIVRKRHAHAWTLAYIDGRWMELDYTPAIWAELEAESAPWWQAIYDMVSHGTHASYTWWLQKPRSVVDYVLVLVLLLATIYSLKKFPLDRIKLQWSKAIGNGKTSVLPGDDSPFYKIIQYLEQTASPRRQGESVRAWVNRISKEYGIELAALQPLVDQHYRYRFSVRTNDTSEKKKLSSDVDKWFRELTSRSRTVSDQ